MKKFAWIYIIAAAVLWGNMGLFVDKLTGLGFSTFGAAALRITAAAVMYVVFLIIKDKKLFKIKIQDAWIFLALGVLSILSMTCFYFMSIKENGSYSVAAILLYTAPVMVSVMSALFFKESFGARKIAALVIAFAGCVLVSGILDYSEGACLSGIGMIYGLLSGFCYALYSIFGKFALEKYSPYTVSTYAFVFAAAGCLFVCDIPEIIKTAVTINTHDVVLWSVLTGLISAFLPFLFYTLGLKNTEPGKASILASVEPLAATVVGLLCGQTVSIGSAFGIVCILAAVFILTAPQKAKNAKE